MIDVLTGFAVVAVAIITGYVIGRIDLLGENAEDSEAEGLAGETEA